MRHSISSTLLSYSLLMLSTPVMANGEDSSIFGDIDTVSIATGMERPIITAPAVASVFSAKYIKNSGAKNLADILNMVPGIHVGVSMVNFSPIYAVRGFSSAYNRNILIMIDGVPQDDLAFSDRATALGKVPIDVIERVEVSRGPGSSLWGGDAFSAVVNIITKTRTPDASSITIEGGSYNTRNARMISGAKVLSNFDLVAAFEYSKTDGYSPTIERDSQTLIDAQLGTDASLAPGNASTDSEESGAHINLSNGHSRFGLRAYHLNTSMGIGLTASLDPYGNIKTDGFEALYRYNKDITSDFSFDATLSYSQSDHTIDNLHFFPPGAFGVFPDGVIVNEKNRQNFTRLNSALRYSGLDDHFLTLGIGGERSKVEALSESRNYFMLGNMILPTEMHDTLSDPIPGKKEYSKSLNFAYLQDEWLVLTDWSITLGARYDDDDEFGPVTSQRAVLQWNTTHALTTKLLYGRGYRIPTLMDTKSRYIPAFEANPELEPEKLDQIQLVFDYRPTQRIRSRIDLFYHETDNQIRYQSSMSGLTFHPENVGDQTGRGFELELWWDFSEHTKFYSYYAYQDNTDKTTNEDAGYSPHNKVFAMLQYDRPDGWFFSTKMTYVGNRDRIAEDTRSKADCYTFVDLLIRNELTRSLEATLEIRNIFDTEAEEAGMGTAFPGDIPLPGRSYYLKLSTEF
jgi:outer membrane receptor for ferrienterochelin and colicin